MKAECPNTKKQTLKILPAKLKGKRYQMNLKEAKEEIDVASSAFLVNLIPVKILFNSRAYPSFVSHEFGRRIKLLPKRLSTPIMVEVIGGRNLTLSNRL